MSSEVEQPYAGRFLGTAHHFALRVYIEDTDLGGVVYHANYLRYFERARSDLLRCLGINQRAAIENGLGVYAVAEMRIKYLQPARLEDELVVISTLAELGGASCSLNQKITRGREVITTATVLVAFLSPAGRARRHPPEWLEKLQRLKQTP